MSAPQLMKAMEAFVALLAVVPGAWSIEVRKHSSSEIPEILIACRDQSKTEKLAAHLGIELKTVTSSLSTGNSEWSDGSIKVNGIIVRVSGPTRARRDPKAAVDEKKINAAVGLAAEAIGAVS